MKIKRFRISMKNRSSDLLIAESKGVSASCSFSPAKFGGEKITIENFRDPNEKFEGTETFSVEMTREEAVWLRDELTARIARVDEMRVEVEKQQAANAARRAV